MAFSEGELQIVNRALGRINQPSIEISQTTSNAYLKSELYYQQTRDALLRSFDWPWAIYTEQLAVIQTLTLGSAPSPESFSTGAVLTGVTSNTTCTVLEVVSSTEYVVAYLQDEFTDGEDIVDDAETPNTATGQTGYPTTEQLTPANTQYSYQYQLPVDYIKMVKTPAPYNREKDVVTIEGHRLLANTSDYVLRYVKKITDTSLFDPLFTEALVLALALKLLPALGGIEVTSFRQDLKIDYMTVLRKAKAVAAAEIDTCGDSYWNKARYTWSSINDVA